MKCRYEMRIKLIEKQIEELKVDNRSPARKYKQVRSTNPVEEAFDEVLQKVKGEIIKRRGDNGHKNQSMKISRSQPTLQTRKDISIQAGETQPDFVSLDEFTDTDHM